MEKKFKVQDASGRLDLALAREFPAFSRTYLQRLIKEGRVKVNGEMQPARHHVGPGDEVWVEAPEFSGLPAAAQETVPILFEDDHILVVNKPAGLVVHPAGPHQKDTLIQRLWPRLAKSWSASVRQKNPATARPGVVHRLDRGTSGVMILAKTPQAAENLSRQFEDRRVQKVYWALVHGIPKAQEGRIRSQVGRSRVNPSRMSVSAPGRGAETFFRVLKNFPEKAGTGAALLEVRPLTGRTHQIRVQLSSLGHPLVGDAVYGDSGGEAAAHRPFLHALSLELAHPFTGRKMKWQAPIPADFQITLEKMGDSM